MDANGLGDKEAESKEPHDKHYTVLQREISSTDRLRYGAETYDAFMPEVDSKNGGDRSPYLVSRLFETNDENLFNHVKFNLIKQTIDRLGISNPKILDVGCGLQVSRHYLQKLGIECRYFGIDYEHSFNPDAVVDLNDPDTLKDVLPWEPDVVLVLDVLEHLHEEPAQIENVVKNLRGVIGDNSEVIITLPQLYRMDRFKLDHLHYPEHKIRLRQDEWKSILETSFDISEVQGLGYLSVIPYLPMLSKRYKPDNRLGHLFNYLRGTFFEWQGFKPLDLWLSNTIGKLKMFKTISNDIYCIARPKKQ